jgi:hypothetical protein
VFTLLTVSRVAAGQSSGGWVADAVFDALASPSVTPAQDGRLVELATSAEDDFVSGACRCSRARDIPMVC